MKHSKSEEKKMAQQRALKNMGKKNRFRKAYGQESTKTPVYKSGMKGGKPINYAAMKKGIITSLD